VSAERNLSDWLSPSEATPIFILRLSLLDAIKGGELSESPFHSVYPAAQPPPFSRVLPMQMSRQTSFAAFSRYILQCSWVCGLCLAFVTQSGAKQRHPTGPIQEAKRPVTVADAVRMAKVWDNGYDAAAVPGQDVGQVSPDGKKILIIVKKGNLDQNTNDYSLLFWSTAGIFHHSAPETLLTLSSSSNREAIKDVRWFSDGETVAFLGARLKEPSQVYAFNTRTRNLRRITKHPTNVISYSITFKSDHVAYIAEASTESIWNSATRRKGMWITGEYLSDLIRGVEKGHQPELFCLSTKLGNRPKKLPITVSGVSALSLSPNGRYIVVSDFFKDQTPETWKEYTDPRISQAIAQPAIGGFSRLQRYLLIDTRTGQARILLNSPVKPDPSGSEKFWSPDGTSVVLTNTYLPLEGTEGVERKERQVAPFTFEVQVPGGKITKISQEDLRLLGWNPTTNRLVFEVGRMEREPGFARKVFFQKEGGIWREVSGGSERISAPEIALKQDMNTAPTIVLKDPTTHKEVVLLDLNPEFRDLKFGRVEQIQWKTTDGQTEKGRLYYPVDYVPEKHYPLVIQTHAYDQPYRFEIDGPFTTAFAGQPFAGKGIMVLETQIHHSPSEESPREADEARMVYESAIEYLSRKELIDLERVGIIGFSRTCFHVKAALTSSKYHFAAAAVTDGVDPSYVQYIVYGTPDFDERFNGGVPPFGDGLKLWLQHSPGFHIDSVHTPLLITAITPDSLLGEWEWFAALRRLHKPVEMLYLEDGSHILERPWDRVASQQGNVDWFVFWLKGEEDPDPAKAQQYARWRQMR
jgi:dipeptidyl aminopeptidase/acylaminoacyl peptidase